MKNAVIIVNYNQKELLQKCLTSLFVQKYDDFTVFVVDNGSKDGSVNMVKRNFSYVDVVEMGYNSGFCKANNVGIKKAIDKGCENIIFLNNDTEVDENFLEKLVNCVDSEKNIDMVAPKILMHSDKSIIDSTGIIITPDGMALNRCVDKRSDCVCARDMKEVFCPTGAAALYSVRLLEDIKQNGMYFDEDFAYYLEDVDMGWRARLRGWKCFYTPLSIVYHHKNATAGARSKFVAFYSNRNNFYNIIKNYPLTHACKAFFLAFFKYPYLTWCNINGKGVVNKFNENTSFVDLFVVTICGWKDVFINLPKFYKKRRYIQKRKKEVDVKAWINDFGVGFFESKK
ncbi:MAG: glycosyl transferase [Candidatus Moraniibacteriota bacterium]|nr:MAG: glycosyl transferase [Candidatus Moranbacteria bacterium]